jgi:hypothetical protein
MERASERGGGQVSLSERDKKELIKHIQIEGTKEKPFMSDLETALFEARVRNFLINEMKEEAGE